MMRKRCSASGTASCVLVELLRAKDESPDPSRRGIGRAKGGTAASSATHAGQSEDQFGAGRIRGESRQIKNQPKRPDSCDVRSREMWRYRRDIKVEALRAAHRRSATSRSSADAIEKGSWGEPYSHSGRRGPWILRLGGSRRMSYHGAWTGYHARQGCRPCRQRRGAGRSVAGIQR